MNTNGFMKLHYRKCWHKTIALEWCWIFKMMQSKGFFTGSSWDGFNTFIIFMMPCCFFSILVMYASRSATGWPGKVHEYSWQITRDQDSMTHCYMHARFILHMHLYMVYHAWPNLRTHHLRGLVLLWQFHQVGSQALRSIFLADRLFLRAQNAMVDRGNGEFIRVDSWIMF